MVLKRRENPSHFSNMLRFMLSVLAHHLSRKISRLMRYGISSHVWQLVSDPHKYK